MKSKLLCYVAAAAVAGFGVSASSSAADAVRTSGPGVMRLLTGEQYTEIVQDTFGEDIIVSGRFAGAVRASGLVAISLSQASVSPAQIDQFDSMARGVAAQVVDPAHRELLIHCKPASERNRDDACARDFLGKIGEILFRRPLTEAELAGRVNAAGDAAAKVRNFYDGLAYSLATLLVAPEFLFRQEIGVPDPAQSGQYVLDSYAKASRLSFFLWNTQPDPELLRAAKSGELDTPKGVAAQVDRMMTSRRFEHAVRAFFTDMLAFDEFDSLEKDAAIFPKFTGYVSRDAREQTLRTLVDLLVTNRGDYRDIFTTRKTFLTPVLAPIYGLPLAKTTPNMEPANWQPVELPEGDPRAGILAHVSFTALHSQPGRSSPTYRGKALREVLLCQRVPSPPANVNFSAVEDGSGTYKTARDRLTAHSTTPACAGCHKVMDPMGLALENFDGAGSFRTSENGASIDTSGALNGKPFKDSLELAKVLHDDPAIPTCLVTRAVTYGVGRDLAAGEKPWLEELKTGFTTDKYRIPELFRRIATSPEFFRVSEPKTAPIKAAAAQ